VSIDRWITVTCDGQWDEGISVFRNECEGDWGEGFKTVAEATTQVRKDGWSVSKAGVFCPRCVQRRRAPAVR
jgi:hypothetical protein